MTLSFVLILGSVWLALAGPGPSRSRTVLVRARAAGRDEGASSLGRARTPSLSRISLTSRMSRALAAGSVGLVALLGLGGGMGAVAGVIASGAVWRWLSQQEARHEQERRRRLAADLPHAVDLFAALLRAGQAPSTAAEAVGAVVAGPAGEVLAGVARRDRAGLDAYAVWRPLTEHEGTRVLGGAMLRSLDSGARVVDVGERVAEELRRDLRAGAAAHARAIGVRATGPLAACFLPALVLIGVVPFVASLVMPLLAAF